MHTQPPVDFSDLEDASEWNGTKPTVRPVDAEDAAMAAEMGGQSRSKATVARFPCPKCNGTGRYTFGYVNIQTGKCHKCNGVGYFKTSPEARAKLRERTAAKKAAKVAATQNEAKAFLESRPDVRAWFKRQEDRGQQFGMDLQLKLYQYGSLTPGQLAAVERSIQRDAEYDAQRAVRDAERAVADADRMVNGLDVSVIPTGTYLVGDVQLCVDNITKASKWQGWVFVKKPDRSKVGSQRPGDRYKGGHEAELRIIAGDAKGASIAFGKLTGVCGVCGRHLENPESVAAGIGPICAGKF
jgi:hypothetical protein